LLNFDIVGWVANPTGCTLLTTNGRKVHQVLDNSIRKLRAGHVATHILGSDAKQDGIFQGRNNVEPSGHQSNIHAAAL